ncbi:MULTISPECIES: replication-relaxation family protein [unclassified Bradyrhizobium]|uniref:replication-relaxation family protein n=1 Tax=Bradyrhizobium sp. 26S5 TaxID=3139729 RepID=UPI0039C87C96
MHDVTNTKRTRRPRFRRSSEPPVFRVTDDDVVILRLLARHRFLRSTHISALVDRSLDRTNDRLCRPFHAGYIDRPRARLDYYPTAGSAPMVYALADLGANLLNDREPHTALEDRVERKESRSRPPVHGTSTGNRGLPGPA